MNPGFRFRLVAFVLAIAAMVLLLAWASRTSWKRLTALQARFATVDSESFRIADQCQQRVLRLNNRILRLEIHPESAGWQAFRKESETFNQWIDEQYAKLPTPQETNLLRQLDLAYDDYLAVAQRIEVQWARRTSPPPSPEGVESFEKESERLLKLGYDLAGAHRQSINRYRQESARALAHLRWLNLGALVLLVGLGGGLATLVYRDLIAPLRTKLVESHAAIERQEKLASLGMLAAGVAHEIRNPLTAIKARLFSLQKHLPPDSPLSQHADVIGGEIDRLERIVKDFLQFARPSDPVLALVPAERPLREVQALLAPQLAQRRIHLRLDGTVTALVRTDAEQIKQVLINLVQNAADSIAQDGTVTLRARLESKPLRGVTRPVVVLEVADTGRGMTPEVEKRLFDPFFTTKEGGTGLGLSIAARLVEKHGGLLQYATQVNRGTTFGIMLPRMPDDSTDRQNPAH
jgi:signal transduction histidine kinase